MVAFVAWLVVAAFDPSNAVVVLMSFSPVWIYLGWLRFRAWRDEFCVRLGSPNDATSAAPTPWRQVDAEFSDWGVWRANLGSLACKIQRFHDPNLERKYILRIMNDWTRRSPRGGRVIRIYGALVPTLDLFVELSRGRRLVDVPRRYKVYRLMLEDHLGVRRFGFLWLGDDWAEFKLIRSRNDREPDREIVRAPRALDPAYNRRVPYAPKADPMWDRWLDGP